MTKPIAKSKWIASAATLNDTNAWFGTVYDSVQDAIYIAGGNNDWDGWNSFKFDPLTGKLSVGL